MDPNSKISNVQNTYLKIDQSNSILQKIKSNYFIERIYNNILKKKSLEIVKFNIKSENNSSETTSNVFYRSNSNTIKRKTGFNELNIDNDKYNSIEVNRNNGSYMNYIRNKKDFISSLNRNIILRGIYENENEDIKFNYIEKFESLKKRMNDLMTNLFDLLKNKFN